VTYYGVRGSVPTRGRTSRVTDTNTPCVALVHDRFRPVRGAAFTVSFQQHHTERSTACRSINANNRFSTAQLQSEGAALQAPNTRSTPREALAAWPSPQAGQTATWLERMGARATTFVLMVAACTTHRGCSKRSFGYCVDVSWPLRAR